MMQSHWNNSGNQFLVSSISQKILATAEKKSETSYNKGISWVDRVNDYIKNHPVTPVEPVNPPYVPPVNPPVNEGGYNPGTGNSVGN